MKQLNEYCGVVFRSKGSLEQLPSGFKEVRDNCFVKSSFTNLFDGCIDDQVGAWSKASFQDDKLTLSRDRVGGRFIYYYENKDLFCFANTIKQLLKLKQVPFRVSKQGAFEFLFLGKVGDMIEGITSLSANSSLELNLRTFSKRIKKVDHDFEEEEITDERTSAEMIRTAILERVSRVSGESESLASFLSGGIDSSVIASALFLNGKHKSIPFITGISTDKSLNELEFASPVVSKLGISTWHQVLAQNIDKEIENLHEAMEFPTTSLGSFLQYEMMRFCQHQGIKEVFDGTGADALYAGHNYYHAIYWNELIRKGKMSKAIRLAIASQVSSNNFKYYWKNILKYSYLPNLSITNKLKFHYRNNEILLALNSGFVEENRSNLEKRSRLSLKKVNPFLFNEFFGGGVEELLRFTDRIGKYFGVMNRSIFIETPAIYNDALRISSDLKFKNGYSKYILRKAFEDVLPQEVLGRKDKMGLVAPNNAWMKQHKEVFLSYFTEDLEPFFDMKEIRHVLSLAIDNSNHQENFKVFRFISFAIWFKVMSK